MQKKKWSIFLRLGEKSSKIAMYLLAKSLNASNNIEHIDGPEGLDAVPESIEHAIQDGIDLNGTPLPKEMVGFYKEVMQKEAERICRVRVAMRKKIIATGSKHYDQETMNQRLLDAGWEGLKAAEIAYFFS